MGRSSDARERLIAAAREVIYARSYEAVSVDALCAAAGVRKSSFYHFFSSKQDLILVVIESQWQRVEETFLKPAFVDDLPLQEQIMRSLNWCRRVSRLRSREAGISTAVPSAI